jgi:two-component system sensor histidine kinase DesK
MTDVISARTGLGCPDAGPHDERVTASTYPGPGLVGLRRLTWWVTAACLFVIAALVAAQSAGVLAVVGACVVCAVAALLFAGSILGRPVVPGAVVVPAALVAAGLLVLSRVVAEGGFPWPLPLAAVLAAAHAGAARPWRSVWPVGLALALVASLAASLVGSWWGGSVSWSGAVQDTAIVALGAWGLLAQIWMLRVAERLDRARRVESAAAVTGERLRFAADLHDIQGHSLQVIALKSELAERLAGVDPRRAVAEMREVQALARQALGDTRAVVQGYRKVTLETEMSNAARVLTAAGIDCRVDAGPSGLPEDVAALIGLVVREGTTNVIRHSAAGHCSIVLSVEARVVHLRISNDAPLGVRPGPAGGLATLQDRLISGGGTLRWRTTAGEFVVEASLPAGPEAVDRRAGPEAVDRRAGPEAADPPAGSARGRGERR